MGAVAALVMAGLPALDPLPASAVPVRSPAGSPATSQVGPGAIDATQAQVDAIEAQLASEQDTLASLSERYDQANVGLSQV